MTNKFYVPGEQRAEKVEALFNTIASRYDLINDLQSFGLHRWWKRRLIHEAASHAGEHALDLCCGTGDVAFALARRGVDVAGIDFSEPMLAIAAGRLAKQPGAGRIRFLRGDAQQLPFSDNSFDLVTISYGLRNLADWETGLKEMQRVARPGGRLLVLDFGRPDNAVWRGIYFAYLRNFVPLLGRIFCGDADTHGYILESLIHYAGQRGVEAGMKRLGLENVRVVNSLGGIMGINYGQKSGASKTTAI